MDVVISSVPSVPNLSWASLKTSVAVKKKKKELRNISLLMKCLGVLQI